MSLNLLDQLAQMDPSAPAAQWNQHIQNIDASLKTLTAQVGLLVEQVGLIAEQVGIIAQHVVPARHTT